MKYSDPSDPSRDANSLLGFAVPCSRWQRGRGVTSSPFTSNTYEKWE